MSVFRASKPVTKIVFSYIWVAQWGYIIYRQQKLVNRECYIIIYAKF